MYAEVFEYLKLHGGSVSYTALLKYLRQWYGQDVEEYLDVLLTKYPGTFEYLPMRWSKEEKRTVPREVRLA